MSNQIKPKTAEVGKVVEFDYTQNSSSDALQIQQMQHRYFEFLIPGWWPSWSLIEKTHHESPPFDEM